MKVFVVLSTICLFLYAGPINAEEQSDLNGKVQVLETKVDSLNQKLEGLKNNLEPKESSLLGNVSIGGHLKFALYDASSGERNGKAQNNGFGWGFWSNHNVIFYISKELSNWLKIEIDPEIDAKAGATPSLGSDIKRDSTNTWALDIYQAHMTAYFHNGMELKVGKFNPMFSESYANESWWHDLYHLTKPAFCGLFAYHDTGFELFKNFDFTKFSLPVYFTLLNGVYKTEVDNNSDKMVLVHIGPEFFKSQLKILGSFAYGKYDADDKYNQIFSLGGLEWKYKKFTLLGEFASKFYENMLVIGTQKRDAKNEGYYIRGKYAFNPKINGILQYGQSKNYITGKTITANYDVSTVAIDYNLLPSSTIIAQFDYVDSEYSDHSEKLKYNRLTIGWRTTF